MAPLFLSFGSPAQSPNALCVQFGFGENYIQTVHFKCSSKTLRASGDVLFCLGLLPAMELGVDLVIDEPVDGFLLDNSNDIQTLIGEWYPWYKRIKIIAERGHSTYPSHRGTGLFYSGGVDSSYSLAMEAPRLAALVTISGIEAGINSIAHSTTLRDNLNHVATEFNLEAIEVETNIRDITDPLIGWEEYHGSLLAAVRHMLADHLEEQLVAASDFEVCRTRQWGSHPELDPLLGTKNARIKIHGLEDRLTKIQKIADDARLLDHIKVCYKSDVNCGMCRKCTYAMEALDVIGKIDQAPSFPSEKLGHGTIAIVDDSSVYDIIALRNYASQHGDNRALVKRLDAVLRRHDKFQMLSRLVAASNWKRRFKRLKRQWRYRRKARTIRLERPRVP